MTLITTINKFYRPHTEAHLLGAIYAVEVYQLLQRALSFRVLIADRLFDRAFSPAPADGCRKVIPSRSSAFIWLWPVGVQIGRYFMVDLSRQRDYPAMRRRRLKLVLPANRCAVELRISRSGTEPVLEAVQISLTSIGRKCASSARRSSMPSADQPKAFVMQCCHASPTTWRSACSPSI